MRVSNCLPGDECLPYDNTLVVRLIRELASVACEKAKETAFLVQNSENRGGEEGYGSRLLFMQPTVILVYVLILEAVSKCLPLKSPLGFSM